MNADSRGLFGHCMNPYWARCSGVSGYRTESIVLVYFWIGL